jgi:hypothetical protein
MKTLAGIFVFFCLAHFQVYGQKETTDLLKELDKVIAERAKFEKQKTERIDRLKRRLAGTSVAEEFELTSQIFDEYKSFIYDSAFRYALRLQALAKRLKNPVHVYNSKINLGFILVSAGLFNETLDTLHALRPNLLPDSLKSDFFFLIGRTYFDVAEFNKDDYYSVRYRARGNRYLDSCLRYLPSNSPRYLLVLGLKAVHTDDFETSAKAYERLLSEFTLSDPEIAVATSTLSFIYMHSDRREEAKQMLIRAAIADIRSSTKETVALRNLAEMLFYEDKVEKSYDYIKIAMDDASENSGGVDFSRDRRTTAGDG